MKFSVEVVFDLEFKHSEPTVTEIREDVEIAIKQAMSPLRLRVHVNGPFEDKEVPK